MMSAKLATPCLLKIKIFRNKGYDVIIPDYDVVNKSLSRDSNDIVGVVMRGKFRDSSISMRDVIITSILPGFDEKNHFFDEWSRFKFHNLGLVLVMTLKSYTSLAKEFKLRFKNFWELSPTFVEVTRGKPIGETFLDPPS